MLSKAKDYRPLPKYENLYLINSLGRIKSLDRKINYRGREIVMKENTPVVTKIGTTLYVVIRDKDYKNRRINLSREIKNVFGRQKQIEIKNAYVYCPVIPKPINYKGRAGIKVEQWLDGKCIEVFETFALAAKSINGKPRHISDAAYGKRSFYAGYQWKLKQ